MSSFLSKRSILLFLLFYIIPIQEPHRHQHRCSNRLENALKSMRRRSLQVRSSRSYLGDTPYTIYHSLYGAQNDDADKDYNADRGYYAKHMNRDFARPNHMPEDAYMNHNKPKYPHDTAKPKVAVEDLKIKLPQSTTTRWVEVEKCKFSTENSTLDTRLIFPDLTISGKVILQPTGGKCNMILRLRHAGIEFRTIPIGFRNSGNEESRRIGSASVRTDSHFAEPGFISVFAHSCQSVTGRNSLRQNSKRRFGFVNPATAPHDVQLSEPEVLLGTSGNSIRWGKYYNPYKPDYDIRSDGVANDNFRDQSLDWGSMESASREFIDPNADNFYRTKYRHRRNIEDRQFQNYADDAAADIGARDDQMSFDDDILNVSDDFEQLLAPDARAFADAFGAQNNAGERNEPDMEHFFSMGVRGLLTTYMQKALQPAIKETLMENMGYTLSYG